MSRVDDARALPRRPHFRWAALCVLMLGSLGFVGWRVMTVLEPGPEGGPATASPAFDPALVLVCTVGAAILAVWALMRSRGRTASALPTAGHLEALCEMLDVWQWRTDAQHRLVSLQPPAGGVASDWQLPATAAPLWDHLATTDAASLQMQMKRRGLLHDLSVERVTANGATSACRLRGRAVSDCAGAFAGYIGTLRDCADAGTALTDAPGRAGSDVLGPRAAGGVATEAAQVDTDTNAQTHAHGHANPIPKINPTAHTNGSAAGSGVDSSTSTAAESESFSYTVSHDLRAPIRVVEGFTKILKEDYAHVIDPIGHAHLDRVLGAAARMNGMIDALLDLSKLTLQPLAREPVDLTELAGFVADDLRRQWPDSHVDLEVMPEMHVFGDPTLLRIALENLLGNAWKYSARREKAQIRFQRSVDDPAIFTVSDNGAGFDMRYAERLFGVFQRLHSAGDFPGTGVGLASVRRIIRRHGGEIWAEAEPDRGARFHFTLPQRDAARSD